MISEIFPDLLLVRPENPPGPTQFTYVLKRPEGNIVLGTKADASLVEADLKRIGKIDSWLLGDRHHAVPASAQLARRLGATICCSTIEASALAKLDVTVDRRLPFERGSFADDLEIIPTPGHTKGAFSYLWRTRGRTYLFIGDTLVPVDGQWRYWVTKPNRAQMLATVKMLADLEFDVIVSNSFAATPLAWMEVDGAYREEMFSRLAAELAA